MKTLHIDCTFGIAGDMLLAALVDLGADLEGIAASLRRLPIDPFALETRPVDRCGIRARLLDIALEPAGGVHPHDHGHEHVHGHAGHPHRRAGDILTMVADADLPPRVRRRATAIFTAIAQAEGRIHGIDPAEVHLHEVGAMDSIIDILGVCLALEALDVETITATPVPVGYGVVSMAHGRFPIPAPATLELLKGVPLSTFEPDVTGELTTPTGAAFLATLVDSFRSAAAGTPVEIGYGAGNRDFPHPNVLRVISMETAVPDQGRETIAVLACQLDDATGEQLGHVIELLLEAGALDVFFTPVTMKKSRPGHLVTVLAPLNRAEALELLMLRQTPTFGVRRHDTSRRILERRIETVETPLGSARVKIGSLEGETLRTTPEFEDVSALAFRHRLPFVEVQQVILAAWHRSRERRPRP
ncbi:MAG: TIGR00299 family protein [Salinicola sp.]|uniref:nickel pincer cofactor biosynthesis protein LarC n=1 Tax=uncultured Salinicola sp. TaxID=1193542 RepID=UPI000C8D5D2E|nr:nickel pincer cofactor biosynthesis protein LarC [uncultured Salinicola sp.]MAM56070.1 TIGR00299 family protein [Salinicola sp.]